MLPCPGQAAGRPPHGSRTTKWPAAARAVPLNWLRPDEVPAAHPAPGLGQTTCKG